MPSHFKFKEYCPLVFRDLRERFGVSDEDFMVNLLHVFFIQFDNLSNGM